MARSLPTPQSHAGKRPTRHGHPDCDQSTQLVFVCQKRRFGHDRSHERDKWHHRRAAKMGGNSRGDAVPDMLVHCRLELILRHYGKSTVSFGVNKSLHQALVST